MAAGVSLSTPSKLARVLRDLAERVEKGSHTLSPELAKLLAQEADDAEVEAIALDVMERHASILAALAK